jgi:hypothetical protein
VCPYCDGPTEAGDLVFPVDVPGQSLDSTHRFQWSHVQCAWDKGGGGLVPPICKHWKRKGKCLFEQTCFFDHPQSCLEELELARQQQPKNRRKQNGKGKAGRKKVRKDSRAGCFRRWLLDTYGKNYMLQGSGVLDVAGGKGELAFELVNLNDITATVVDPRPLDLRAFTRKLVTLKIFTVYVELFSLMFLLRQMYGMHHRNRVLANHVDRNLERVKQVGSATTILVVLYIQVGSFASTYTNDLTLCAKNIVKHLLMTRLVLL